MPACRSDAGAFIECDGGAVCECDPFCACKCRERESAADLYTSLVRGWHEEEAERARVEGEAAKLKNDLLQPMPAQMRTYPGLSIEERGRVLRRALAEIAGCDSVALIAWQAANHAWIVSSREVELRDAIRAAFVIRRTELANQRGRERGRRIMAGEARR